MSLQQQIDSPQYEKKQTCCWYHSGGQIFEGVKESVYQEGFERGNVPGSALSKPMKCLKIICHHVKSVDEWREQENIFKHVPA